MIHDSSDSESDDANFCGSEDQFEALFKQFKDNAIPRLPSPTPPAPEPDSQNDDVEKVDDSPSSSKKSKENGENGVEDKTESTDVHEVSTDSCNSNDPDVDNILAEYHDFLETYKGSPSKSKGSKKGTANKSKKGVSTRSASKSAAPAEVVDVDDDIQFLAVTKSPKKPASAPVELSVSDCIDDDILEVIPVEREQITVRVRWKGQIHRFRVYETDTVSRVKDLLATTVGGVLTHEIHFYMNEDEIPLDSWRTVKEINLEFTTIIEALRKGKVQASTSKLHGAVNATYEEELPPHDPTMIPLKLQDGSLRKKTTIVYVKKTSPLSNLRELFLAKSGLEGTKTVDQIKFMFDGEVVDLSETPNSLDFEEDECLDVIIK